MAIEQRGEVCVVVTGGAIREALEKRREERRFDDEADRRIDSEGPDARIQAEPVSVETLLQRRQERLGGESLKPPSYDPVGRTAARLKAWGPVQALFRNDKLRPINLASDLDGKRAEVIQGPQQPAAKGNGRA